MPVQCLLLDGLLDESLSLFDQHRAMLEAFMKTVASLGRLPGPDEYPQHAE